MQRVLSLDTKSIIYKEKLIWASSKFKTFFSEEDSIKRLKEQATEWEKISVNHISDKGLMSRIYKEHSKLNRKNPHRIQLKMGELWLVWLSG